MKTFLEHAEELDEASLSTLALVGALIMGIATGDHSAHVKDIDKKQWKQDYNALTVPQRKKVDHMIDKIGKRK